jgi:hypothetical protein
MVGSYTDYLTPFADCSYDNTIKVASMLFVEASVDSAQYRTRLGMPHHVFTQQVIVLAAGTADHWPATVQSSRDRVRSFR